MAPQRLQTPPNKKIPRKFYHHFLFKALILTVFLVVIPLFPSEPPDFVAPSIFTRNWELLHLVFVGIVVSYGLFSRKNDAAATDCQNNAKFDNAQSYMSKLLHVASVFDEDADVSASVSAFDNNNINDDDHVKKMQTWSSQYVRNEPMLVVADKNTAINTEKPLLLPVRSLKSRVSDEKDNGEFVGRVYNRSNTSPVINKGFSSNSRSLSRNDLIDLVHGEDSGINSRGHVRSNSSTSFKEFSGGGGGGGEGSIGSMNFKSRVGGSNDRVFSNNISNSEMSRSLYQSNSGDVQANSRTGAGAGAGAGGMKSRNGGSSDRVLSNSNIEMSRSLYRSNSSDIQGNTGAGAGGMKSRNGDSNDRVVLNDDTRNSEVSRSIYRSNSSLNSRGLSSRNSRRTSSRGNGELDDGDVEESDGKMEESVVLPSPIPWRSRSGKLEMKGESNDSSTHLVSKISSSPPKVSSPRNLSSKPTISSESEAKTVEDFGRRKINFSSRLPPPPPPPPPPPFQTSKRSQSSSHNKVAKETRTVSSNDTNASFRSKEVKSAETETQKTNSDGYFPRQESSFSEYPKETRDFLERVLLETDDESESEGESYKEERMESTKVDAAPSEIVTDEGPDVDKKADEFIAKFREQIRLQRIESIKKSTGQLNRTSVR